mmetsp:Transcript_3273/g.8752  ORF Transcript_3273/g.8752 Transcript_3273/m.8752 type:complete len:241 (-) Transcript_3273:598-1320(-)
MQQTSASNCDHGPVLCGRNLKHACVLSLFATYGSTDDEAEVLICGTPAHCITQAHLACTKQAHLQVAIGHETEPVALPTKVRSHGRHKRDNAHVSRYSEILGHLSIWVCQPLQQLVVLRAAAAAAVAIAACRGCSHRRFMGGHLAESIGAVDVSRAQRLIFNARTMAHQFELYTDAWGDLSSFEGCILHERASCLHELALDEVQQEFGRHPQIEAVINPHLRAALEAHTDRVEVGYNAAV